jgi:uncharacterized protein involved in type VI secretion and phage assembly
MNKHYASGPTYGRITNISDPDHRGRVKVILPMLGPDIETDWIPILTPAAGIFVLPELNEQVIVAFMGDVADFPIVIGSIWNIKQSPPETGENTDADLNKDGSNDLCFIKSRSGQMVIFDDKKGDEKIQIISGGTRWEFKKKDKLMKISTDAGIDLSAEGKIRIKCKDKATISADKSLVIQGQNVKIESKDKDVNIKSGKNITVNGSSGIALN